MLHNLACRDKAQLFIKRKSFLCRRQITDALACLGKRVFHQLPAEPAAAHGGIDDDHVDGVGIVTIRRHHDGHHNAFLVQSNNSLADRLDQFPILATMRPLTWRENSTAASRCRGVISSRMICCAVMVNFRPASSGANVKPSKTAVPPDARPCATRFHYRLSPAPHLMPTRNRKAVMPPKLEEMPCATLCQSGDAVQNDLLRIARNAAISLPGG